MNRTQQIGRIGLPDGIMIRPVAPGDCAAIGAFVTGLSPRSRFLRFFSVASQPSSPVLRGMCGAGRTTDALVATDGDAVIGHAMAADSVEPDGRRVADIGLVVTDRWQRHGVGALLLSCLASRAAARDVRILTMDVLPENRPMLAIIFRVWADAAWEFAPDAVTIRARLDQLTDSATAPPPAGPATAALPAASSATAPPPAGSATAPPPAAALSG